MTPRLRGATAPVLHWSLLAVVFVVGGCSSDDESDRAALDEDVSIDGAPDVDTATGILVLGSETIEFVVDACDLTASPAAERPTLSGHADLPDGRTLQVTMLRTPIGSTTWHSVALDFGSEYREARRGRDEDDDGWRPIAADTTESALGPLISIDGGVVSAEGSFLSGSGGAAGPVRGSVTATCPDA